MADLGRGAARGDESWEPFEGRRLECAVTDAQQALYDRYQPWRRIVEAGYWVVLMLVSAGFNSVVVLLDVERNHLDFASWEPVAWEWSSSLVLLALVPAVVAFFKRVPLEFGLLRKNLPRHLLASIAFCLVHVVAMLPSSIKVVSRPRCTYSSRDTAG